MLLHAIHWLKMHNWHGIDFPVKHFASRFSFFVLVVLCHYKVDTCSQNPHRNVKSQHSKQIPWIAYLFDYKLRHIIFLSFHATYNQGWLNLFLHVLFERSRSAMSNPTGLLSQKLCRYFNQGRRLIDILMRAPRWMAYFDLSKLNLASANVLIVFESYLQS